MKNALNKVIVTAAAAIVLASPGLAQGFGDALPIGDNKVMKNQIIGMTLLQKESACTQVRGGGDSGRALGVYEDRFKQAFHSKEYLALDPAVQSRWAATMHDFMLHQGGAYQGLLDYQRNHPAKTDITSMLDNSLGTVWGPGMPVPQSKEPEDITYVPYNKLEDLADTFFTTYARDKYKDLAFLYKDWFKNDAILDGFNLWCAYEQKLNPSLQHDLAYETWMQTNLDRYKRKVGPEGKLVAEGHPQPYRGAHQ